MIQKHLLRPLAFIAGSGLCLPTAFSQTAGSPAPAADEDAAVQLAAVTVTGSNIKGVDTEKSLPVSLYTSESITEAGFGSIAELVESMPFSTNVEINESSTGPNDARGDVSTVNLRNLGSGRTLVLVNGRRMSAYGVTPGTPPVQFVNVNAIPLGAIQQVEVLRDGASAIYGSDAIGGVVNTVLKKNYDASEARLRATFGGDGREEINFTFAGGKVFDDGKSKASIVVNAYNRDELYAADRVYAAEADKRPLVTGTPSSNFNRASSSGPAGRFTAVTDTGSSVSVPGVTASNGQFYYNPTTGARTTGAGPTAFYNSQAGAVLSPRVRRFNVFSSFDRDLTETLSFFSEVTYYDAHSAGGFDAIPLSSGTDGVIVPKTNYYSPVGVNSGVATPRNVLIRNYRVMEAGARSYDTWSDSYRLLAGLRGILGTSTWSWESGAMFMRGATNQVNHGYISQSRFEAQLALNTPEAYNPFAPGTNSQAVVDKFVIDIWDKGVGTLASWDAKTSGELLTLPGGAVSVAAGVEVRRETMKQRNDPYGLADDVIAQSEQIDVDAGRNVYGAYSEVFVPIFGEGNRAPGFNQLELRGAVRYEHYKGFQATKPGVSFAWRPTSWLLFRGSYNEGFRAPTVVELYTPAIGRRNTGISDTARVGQPDAISSVSKRVVTGGNVDLNPEESESYNAGVVVDIPFVKGLSFGADVYRIKQFNQIDNSDAQFELDLDADLWAASGGSNPRVIRMARTATDQTNNLPGELVEVLSTYQNLSLREVQGTDAFINYRTPKWGIGRFNFTGMVSYTDKLRTVDLNGVEVNQVRNNGNPRTKATAGVTWSRKGWTASVQERMTSDYLAPSSYTIDGVRVQLDAYWVTNASVGYKFSKGPFNGMRVRFGMNNVFDEQPPFYPASTAGYDSSYADSRGRMSYVDLTLKF